MFLGPEGRKQLRVTGRFSALGIEMGLSVAVGYFGGRWLDGRFGTEPWLMWIGLAFGLAAGARSVYQVARKAQADLSADDDDTRY